MSGSAPPPISGRFGSLKPWQYAVILLVIVAFAAMIPVLRNLATSKKRDAAMAAATAAMAGGKSEAWTPPPPPPVERVVARPPDARPPTDTKPQAEQKPPPQASRPAQAGTGGRAELPDLHMAGTGGGATGQPNGGAGSGGGRGQEYARADKGPLGDMLKPTEIQGFEATRVKNPWATIEQGRILACHSVTPMTSGLPGLVKAKLTDNVWSMDGTTLLLERYSDIIGEIANGRLENGQERFFVLWRQVTTPKPNHVRVTLNSPAADELGQTGLPGDVDRHTWRKIKGVLLLSGIDIATQGLSLGLSNAISGRNNNYGGPGSGFGNLNFYQLTGQGQSLASQLLAHQIQIPDTLHRDQALPCSVFVAGDLDFSSVYTIRRNQ